MSAEFFGDEARDFETRANRGIGEGAVADRGAHQNADATHDPVLKRVKIQRGVLYV